jgi:hypothetical protein
LAAGETDGVLVRILIVRIRRFGLGRLAFDFFQAELQAAGGIGVGFKDKDARAAGPIGVSGAPGRGGGIVAVERGAYADFFE